MFALTAADLTPAMAAMVAVGVFCASFMDAIAGGGGIISVPVYFMTGIPAHYVLGTNKMSACIGTFFSTFRYARKGYADVKLAAPAVVLALAGATIGTGLQLRIPERYLQYVLLLILPAVAAVVLKQRSLPEERGEIEPKKQMAIVCAAAFAIGIYDGFYGPGTGTFLLLVFCNLAKLDVRTAGGTVKFINLASNIGGLCTSLMNGKVFVALGLIGAAASIAGHWTGSGFAIRNGSKIVRPAVITVLFLLGIKVVLDLLGA